MGDSYSSGEGLGSSPEGGDCFDPNTETSTDKCHRSSYAYSAEVLPDQSHTFIACSGATIIDVTSKGQYGEGSQLGQIGNPSTVMLTLGGDDLDFTAGLGSCISAYPFETPLFGSQTGHSDGILGGQTNNCQGWINADEEVVSANGSQPSEMQSDLENTYEQILAKLSPTASLLVGNYPQIFPPTSGSGSYTSLPLSDGPFCVAGADEIGFSAPEVSQFNDVEAKLNRVHRQRDPRHPVHW